MPTESPMLSQALANARNLLALPVDWESAGLGEYRSSILPASAPPNRGHAEGGILNYVLWEDPALDTVWFEVSSSTSFADTPVGGTPKIVPTEPSMLSQALANARSLLVLPDDWDGEGTGRFSRSTVDRAIEFLLEVYREYKEEKDSFPIPDFLPATDRSVDVHWLTKPFELLVNIGDGGRIGSFFGDRYGTGVISGPYIPNSREIADWIAANIQDHRGAEPLPSNVDRVFDWGGGGVFGASTIVTELFNSSAKGTCGDRQLSRSQPDRPSRFAMR